MLTLSKKKGRLRVDLYSQDHRLGKTQLLEEEKGLYFYKKARPSFKRTTTDGSALLLFYQPNQKQLTNCRRRGPFNAPLSLPKTTYN
jgi:hypothetical protein